jgi:hypothetical protein
MVGEYDGRKFVAERWNVASEAGYPLRSIPTALRDELGFADPRSWAALLDDPTLALVARCELVYGPRGQRLGQFLGVTPRQVSTLCASGELGFVHGVGQWGITCARSLQHWRRDQEAAVSTARREAGLASARARGFTDVSGGSNF